MSDEGVLTKQDVAAFVLETVEADVEPGEGIAQRVMAVNALWAIWDSVGEVETACEISEEEADKILEKLPLSYDDVAEDGLQ